MSGDLGRKVEKQYQQLRAVALELNYPSYQKIEKNGAFWCIMVHLGRPEMLKHLHAAALSSSGYLWFTSQRCIKKLRKVMQYDAI